MSAGARFAVAAAVVVLSAAAAVADTFDVTRFDDPASSGTGLSLRQAVIAANASPGPDTITLHRGTYLLTLRGEDSTSVAGDLDITSAITVEGDLSGKTVIDAKRCRDRSFEVFPGGNLTVRDVTFKNGHAPISGGGIYNVGTLTVEHCRFIRNYALNRNSAVGGIGGGSGGGVDSEGGTCTISDSVFSANRAANDGGAVAFDVGGTAFLTRVTMSGKNHAGDTGGGVEHDDGVQLTITDSTISGNIADNEGGGLDPGAGSVTLTNVTVSGNRARKGGGIQLENAGILILDHCTIAFNRAKEGAGLWTEAGTVTSVRATIIAKNSPRDCFGPVTSAGSNIIGNGDGCILTGDPTGNQVGSSRRPLHPVNPRLGPLRANGGPTMTHALLGNSPAIDAVIGTCAPSTDQRGSPRFGACDIGAYEVQ